MIKKLHTVLVIVVSLTVLSAWSFRVNRPSLFRGGDATSMLEEFQAYGLSKNTMISGGVGKGIAAIALPLGLRFQKLVVPAAAVMAGFMCAAIYFHLSISDPLMPTAPSTLMMLSCLGIIFIQKKLSRA